MLEKTLNYSIVIEKVEAGELPEGWYYAHIPALDLTTHGEGIDGARQAAQELATVWIEEKLARKEMIPVEQESFFGRIQVSHAVQSA